MIAIIRFQEKAICIICNEKKYSKRQRVEVKTISIKELKETVHKAERILIKYAKSVYI